MVKKTQKPETASATEAPSGVVPPNDFKDSAQQIWLAGLGAFSKVQAEGGKVFETLVKDGLALQRQTQKEAEERLAAAASRLSKLGTGWTGPALAPMDKLESIFEDRVAKALHKLGMPSAQDLSALVARVDKLQQELLRLKPPGAKPRTARKVAKGTD